jgi:exonuclease SbcD
VRYAGSPFPLSSTERDYRHSIAVVRLTQGDCTVDLVPIPRPVAFLSVGPVPLDEAVAAIEALDLDPTMPGEIWPFIEIAVRIDGPEPHLQARILGALEDKPLRLVRILSVRAETSEAAKDPMSGADLAELAPHDVFAALFRRDYGGEALLRIWPPPLPNCWSKPRPPRRTADAHSSHSRQQSCQPRR